MSFLKSCPSPSNIVDIFRLYPERAQPILHLCEEVLRKDSPLSVAQRELIFAFGSAQNACGFCYESHKAVAEVFGIDASLLEQLIVDIDSAPVEEPLKPLLKYAKKLTLTPSKMTQADADAVFEAGWSEKAFVDMVCVCATQNCLNRFVDGTGVDAAVEDSQRAGRELLPTIGYLGILDKL
jgi:uncharacterized peroxidase-related enzyme